MTRPPSRWRRSPASSRSNRPSAPPTSAAIVVRIAPGATTTVQAAITRFAADHGQTVTENHVVRLGLEDVFLRLVNTKERAA